MDHVLVATYQSLGTAEDVVQSLVEQGVERSTIGLAKKDNSADAVYDETTSADTQALVTVTTEAGSGEIRKVMKIYDPLVLDTRDVQWRMEEGWSELEFVPNMQEFTAVGRAKIEESPESRSA